MKDTIYKNKVFILSTCIAVAIIITLIVCIWKFTGNKVELPENTATIDTTENMNLIDTENIVSDVAVGSNIGVISNKNNEQADIILNTMGVDTKDLISYSASIDTTHESGHAICILKPKEAEYEKVKLGLIGYISTKQRVLQDTGKVDTAEYKAAESAVINEKDGYLILVLESDSEGIMENITTELDKALNKNKE